MSLIKENQFYSTENMSCVVDPGMFFRAKLSIATGFSNYDIEKHGCPKEIPQGMVLLVQEVRVVDDSPHTIILRAHPSWIPFLRAAHQGEEIRFLTEDFASKFEWEPDSDDIREAERAAAQQRIADIQEEMVQLQSNPAEMQRLYLKSLQDQGQTTMPVPVMPNMATPENVMQGDVAQFQAQVKIGREMVDFAAKTLTSTAEKLRDAVGAIAPYYEETGAVAMARVKNASRFAGKVMEGVETLDLWLGKEVVVNRIKKGASASSDIPVTIYQQVLFSDEELAQFDEVNDRFDWSNEQSFLRCLDTIPNLLQTILPAERGVVAIAIRRNDLDYGDGFANWQNNTENKTRFLLIRDGENLYQVFSPLWPHRMLSRLFPSKKEIDNLFSDWKKNPITFRDLSYTDALQNHEKRALMYKRLLVLLGGLQVREELMGPFCSEREAKQFVSVGFQEKYLNFIHDEDGAGMLPSGEKRTTWREYIRQANSVVTESSFIAWQSNHLIDEYSAPHLMESSGRGQQHCRVSVQESSGVGYAKMNKEQQLTIGVPTTRGRFSDKIVTSRILLIKDSQGWLNLDAVTIEDLKFYIRDRHSRENHSEYIRMFKAAVKSLENQYNEFMPQYDMIGDESADAKVDRDLILRLWKTAHPGEVPNMSKKVIAKSIRTLIWGPIGNENSRNDLVSKVTAFLEEKGKRLLRIEMDGNESFYVFAEKNKNNWDNRLIRESNVLLYVGTPGNFGIPTEEFLMECPRNRIVLFENKGRSAYWTDLSISTSGKKIIIAALEMSSKDNTLYDLIAEASRANHWTALKPIVDFITEFLSKNGLRARQGYILMPVSISVAPERKYHSTIGLEVWRLNIRNLFEQANGKKEFFAKEEPTTINWSSIIQMPYTLARDLKEVRRIPHNGGEILFLADIPWTGGMPCSALPNNLQKIHDFEEFIKEWKELKDSWGSQTFGERTLVIPRGIEIPTCDGIYREGKGRNMELVRLLPKD